ncbi:GNAT family N-acetyltransferase [Salisediminibacterium beveridgei]|uniref:Spermine/spermidine acetyltransferase n=1 Tax=Salisediminibacterium beveridgei TaxID=632773 RepID=A0A1D7QZR9_9BACI|nr:GNAT family N-acetyltransferase [Salisediminibacterium beveridgei]AOM84511.1 Spermine/spermidine acetyltransferase [Salisediminibacterium beveridgei]
MSLSIRPVNADNWRAIIALEPKPEQAHLIEPNAVSMLESFFDRDLKWQCYGLYEGDVPVGFLMIGARDYIKRYIWLDRFMLDVAYQGDGRGQRFLEHIVAFISENFFVKTIKTSMKAENTHVKHLYKSVGFEATGTIDPEFDEEVWVYNVKKNRKRRR